VAIEWGFCGDFRKITFGKYFSGKIKVFENFP
jgi:hypothetical protein